MASELYRDILKDKDGLNKSNPRTRSFGGGLTSSDNDYKNYLAGMRPRTKSNNVKQSSSTTSSFVDSAARRAQQNSSAGSGKIPVSTESKPPTFTQRARNKSDSSDKDDIEKKKQYSELSSVPSRKSVDNAFKSENSVNHEKSRSDEIDFSSLKQTQSDLTGSVGRLRSMFDKSPEAENKAVIQLRANKGKKERPYSASFDPIDSRSKTKVSGTYDRHSVHISPHEVDSFISMNGKEDQINGESPKEEDDTSKVSKIDVDSILAPEEPKKSEENDVKEENSSQANEIELKKQIDIDRMKRTQEEMQIEQRFNIKRKTLKEKLSDLAGGSESVVSPYIAPDSDSKKIEKVAPPVAAKPDTKLHLSTDNKVVVDNKKDAERDVSKSIQSEATSERSNQSNTETNFFSNDEPDDEISSDEETTATYEVNTQIDSNDTQVNDADENLYMNGSISMNGNMESDKDSRESEIDKYRSAVERFDDFINKQENLFGLDEDDPLKDFPNDFTPEDSSKLFDTEIPSETQQKINLAVSKEPPPAENNPSDLMNSILNHMEKSKGENKDYVSMLRSSSQESDSKSQKLASDISMPLVSPEAPPRLSKLQGRTPPVSASPPPPQPAPTSPSPVFVDDPPTSRADTKQEPTEDQQPQRPSSLSISTSSTPNSVSSAISYMPGESESETEESGYYSVNSVNSSDYYNNNTNIASVNGNVSDNYPTYQPTYEPLNGSESETTKLPPPPPKSNLRRSKPDKKRKV